MKLSYRRPEQPYFTIDLKNKSLVFQWKVEVDEIVDDDKENPVS